MQELSCSSQSGLGKDFPTYSASSLSQVQKYFQYDYPYCESAPGYFLSGSVTISDLNPDPNPNSYQSKALTLLYCRIRFWIHIIPRLQSHTLLPDLYHAQSLIRIRIRILIIQKLQSHTILPDLHQSQSLIRILII